jgi:hypothetical protein
MIPATVTIRPRLQTTNTVLMIRPVAFHSNPETAASNAFQRRPGEVDPACEQAAALREFDGLVDTLRAYGVEVIVEPDTESPQTPDSVFPNNWVSFHADGTIVLYPMMARSRRAERRPDILERLAKDRGFRIGAIVDLSFHEADGRFLESTGSMVLDRVNRVAYACLSPRTDLDLIAEFGQRLEYEPVAFAASDATGVPIYHTNVMMALGEGFAVLCAEAIDDAAQSDAVLRKLEDTGHEVVVITRGQMGAFAGNMLALRAPDDGQLLAMSARAADSLTPDQRATLERYARIVAAPIDSIEDSAGGSVRCMLAEVHLPRKG